MGAAGTGTDLRYDGVEQFVGETPDHSHLSHLRPYIDMNPFHAGSTHGHCSRQLDWQIGGSFGRLGAV
jgi:hypothetical protein